jgi:hypothetical protein|tara:strand:- start:3891 stop:4298 length:408 start_codon:yes stop_codon:yes gene_type:complete
MKIFSVTLIILLMSACATPTTPTYDLAPLAYYDEDTEYAIVPFDGGFDVSIAYSKWNLVHYPEDHQIQCTNKIVSIAKEFSETSKRALDMPNVRRIIFFHKRDPWSGVQTCTGNLTLNYLVKPSVDVDSEEKERK